MNGALVDRIVNAVLYEGYMLYPYRPSAVKNRQRFNFGVVYPRVYSDAPGGTDACMMQTECLVLGKEQTQCRVQVRFLRMVARSISKRQEVSRDMLPNFEDRFEPVEQLQVEGKNYRAWQEAVEERIELPEFDLSALTVPPTPWPFRLSATQEQEEIRDGKGVCAGLIVRKKRAVAGTIEVSAVRLQRQLLKLRVQISNDSDSEKSGAMDRELALEWSLVSAHTILEVRDGEFISLVDPPAEYRDYARECRNVGTWPVLVGDEGQRETMLSSPIILYDYPEIAPESPGDLFDGAEIDEILSLRILTMTEEEKREMREGDARARQILERTETLPEEQWMKLHGALRGLRAARGGRP